MHDKTVIVIPTYNEIENIERLLDAIRAEQVDADILVVDDDSPDGTAAAVSRYAEQWPRVHLLLRKGTRGRGSAGIAGFLKALDMGAEAIVEMDADFSHHPRYLKALIAGLDEADVTIGSRFMPGGADLDRGWLRRVITRLAGIYVRCLLRLPIRDVSSGYRCFRRKVLEAIGLDAMFSTGPSVVLEMLYKAILCGFTAKEVPIVFADRRQGQSKLHVVILLQTLFMVLKLRRHFPSRPASCR